MGTFTSSVSELSERQYKFIKEMVDRQVRMQNIKTSLFKCDQVEFHREKINDRMCVSIVQTNNDMYTKEYNFVINDKFMRILDTPNINNVLKTTCNACWDIMNRKPVGI